MTQIIDTYNLFSKYIMFIIQYIEIDLNFLNKFNVQHVYQLLKLYDKAFNKKVVIVPKHLHYLCNNKIIIHKLSKTIYNDIIIIKCPFISTVKNKTTSINSYQMIMRFE